jgi:hypothetical protein
MPGDAQSIRLKPARSADPGSSLSSQQVFRAANAPDPRLNADSVAQRGLQRFPVDLIHSAVMRGLDPRIHHLRKN